MGFFKYLYLSSHKNAVRLIQNNIFLRLIASIRKFSIVIGHSRACFLPNWRAVMWVSNYSCPITTFL